MPSYQVLNKLKFSIVLNQCIFYLKEKLGKPEEGDGGVTVIVTTKKFPMQPGDNSDIV